MNSRLQQLIVAFALGTCAFAPGSPVFAQAPARSSAPSTAPASTAPSAPSSARSSALPQPAVPTSLEQAVAGARERYSGRVLGAQTELRAGRRIHLIRIMTREGRVKNLRVDAATGRELQAQR
ncbi:MAG: hypothetical protein JSW68_02445 [Burkholderiales bacterium]|nr:MAG: hypothetical protein JSW68_02445 [Burkholderiales bacterium]